MRSSSQSVNPAMLPVTVPTPPITNPLKMKIWAMLARVAPIDLRTAMSLRFSITTITRVATMLNAATSTMSSEDDEVHRLLAA